MITVIKKNEGQLYVPPGHDESVKARKFFNPGNGCTKVDAHVTTFAPGSGMDEEVHPVSDHIMYLLKGKLEVRQGGRLVAVVEEGDALRIPAGEPHQVSNPGPGEGMFFVATIPPVG